MNTEQSAVMFLYLPSFLAVYIDPHPSGNLETTLRSVNLSPLRPRCFVTAAVAVDCTSPTHSPGGVPVQDEDIAMGAATDNSWSPNESDVTSKFDRKFDPNEFPDIWQLDDDTS